MKKLALLLILLASPALGQTTFYLGAGAGDISGCTGTDEDFDTVRGSGATTYTLSGTVDTNWNDTTMAGKNHSGTWDCTVNVDVSSGGGAPNNITVTLAHVNSSCSVQATIFTEESGTLTKGTNTDYACTGGTANITFAAGDGLLFTVIQSGGTRVITMNYDGADTDDSEVIMPAEVVASSGDTFFIQ